MDVETQYLTQIRVSVYVRLLFHLGPNCVDINVFVIQALSGEI